MCANCLINKWLYLKKFFNTFCPKVLFNFSPRKNMAKKHWKEQDFGDVHGFDKYNFNQPKYSILLPEVRFWASEDDKILSLGCNCGYFLSVLKNDGFKKLTGIEISPKALEYGKTAFELRDVELFEGSYEDTLPQLALENRSFDCVIQEGKSIELVHPSFDIVKYICKICKRYVILLIWEWTEYTRLWEYEFNCNGFALVKCIRPYNGEVLVKNPSEVLSLWVFQRIE